MQVPACIRFVVVRRVGVLARPHGVPYHSSHKHVDSEHKGDVKYLAWKHLTERNLRKRRKRVAQFP